MCCASCGIAGVDEIKLKECYACDLARYCSDNCKQEHRQEHEAMCKQRAAELRDEILFRQPESTHLGDCPICCLPHPIDVKKYTMMSCCSKTICDGCAYDEMLRCSINHTFSPLNVCKIVSSEGMTGDGRFFQKI